MIDFSAVLPFVGGAFVDWLKIFAAPSKNLEMLWIIVPIWGVWIFSEFFQEKKGTNFGNAITNGATMLFVGVDWIRYVIRYMNAGGLSLGSAIIIKLAISAAIILLGLLIIVYGIKARSFIRKIGRVRGTTYLMLMFSPVIYGVADFSIRNLLIILAFFPVFYIIIELLDRLLPTPKIFETEEEESMEKSLGKGSGITDIYGEPLGGVGQGFKEPSFGSKQDFSQFPAQPPYPNQGQYSNQRRRI